MFVNRQFGPKIFNFAGISSSFMLLLLLGFFVTTPIFQTSNVDATTYQNSSASTTAVVSPVISITATDVAIPELSPSGSVASFSSAYSTVTVTTNNETGYTLSLHDVDTNINMVNTMTSTYNIPSLSASTYPSGVNKNSMPDDTWGYSMDDTTYNAIPPSTSSKDIATTNAPATNRQTNVYFGANITDATTYGTYQDTVTFTATTNKVPDTFWNIETMQQMTSEICGTATTPNPSATVSDTDASHVSDKSYVPQRTLSDIRDGNTYTVRKLADGNCWMVQNLRLGDKNTAITLTNSDTDLNRTSSYTLPIAQTNGGSGWGINPYDSKHLYWTENSTYGVYYSWYTAIAYSGTAYNGTLNDVTTANVNFEDSVCPKGWKLPDKTGNKSFANLLSIMNLTNDATSSARAQNAPLSLVYSGRWLKTGGTYNQGSEGSWWLSTSDASPGSWYLQTNVNISDYLNTVVADLSGRGSGFAVRCVAR